MKVINLMFDSLNRKMLQPYGCDWTKTPNFQRLAEQSVRFDNCYAGSLPCMPARREMHTGRYNFLHRSWGPIEPFDDSMPEILKNNGVYSHLISDHVHYWEDGGATYHNRYNSWEIVRGQEGDKWKCLPELMQPCDESQLQNKDGLYFQATQELQRHDLVNRQFINKEADTPLAKTVQGGVEFIEQNYCADNWFLQIECFDPHEPFAVPEQYQKLYADGQGGIKKDWPPYHHVTEGAEEVIHFKNQYAALLSMCDSYLGKILDMFDKYNLWKDTMLIVNTDHGYLLGEHGWWSKIVMPCYDEIVHTPLFIHDPRFQKSGEVRAELVQTIDLPATVLEFFGIKPPKDMEGRPIRPIIEANQPIRDYVLFGIHGAHINISDGRYVYMKAPSEDNAPLYDYTLMPMHMRNLFTVNEMKDAKVVPDGRFEFTKGCPLWQVQKHSQKNDTEEREEAKYLDNNSLVNAANFGDKLFDLKENPNQESEINDIAIEVRMANMLQAAMKENDCPNEQFTRIGIAKDGYISAEMVMKERANNNQSDIIPAELAKQEWSKGAINTYKALLKFIPIENKDKAINTIVESVLANSKDKHIDAAVILQTIERVVPRASSEMVQYFVELASRTS
jgi:Arylsulfatase A and related enzymes